MQEFFEKSKIKKPQNSDSTANFENHVVTECNRLLTTIDVLEADLDCLMAEIMKLEAGACPSELLEPYNNCFGSTSPQVCFPTKPTLGTAKADGSLKSEQPYGCPGTPLTASVEILGCKEREREREREGERESKIHFK
ncbi:hypothetical protein J6590_088334 [Homalodisca vitripennis]|nr:hypothetical protein J6590_088334 [Homalodisca vitripennis]